jgi:hypothetical protein
MHREDAPGIAVIGLSPAKGHLGEPTSDFRADNAASNFDKFGLGAITYLEELRRFLAPHLLRHFNSPIPRYSGLLLFNLAEEFGQLFGHVLQHQQGARVLFRNLILGSSFANGEDLREDFSLIDKAMTRTVCAGFSVFPILFSTCAQAAPLRKNRLVFKHGSG